MKWLCILALPLAAMLTGCHTTVSPDGDGPFPAAFNSVELLPEALGRRVHVVSHSYERTGTNAFEVTATLKNLSTRPIALQVRTQYFDEERNHQEGPGAWQVVHLPPLGIETYTSTAYGNELSYYHVEVVRLHGKRR
jgi:hypothetical protein